MLYRLSPTGLGLMKECPRCFWLTQNGVWKRPAAPFPSLPNGMDRVLKKHFDSFRDKGLLPPELQKIKEAGLKLFGDNEEQKNLLEIWRNAKKGLRFEDEDGNVLRGAIDNLLVKVEKLVVLDYKTRGYDLKEDTHKHYVDQMSAYSFLLRKNGFATEDFSYLLFYIPDKVLETGEVAFATQLVKVSVDVKNAEQRFIDALRLLNGPCPLRHTAEMCEWCRFVEV